MTLSKQIFHFLSLLCDSELRKTFDELAIAKQAGIPEKEIEVVIAELEVNKLIEFTSFGLCSYIPTEQAVRLVKNQQN